MNIARAVRAWLPARPHPHSPGHRSARARPRRKRQPGRHRGAACRCVQLSVTMVHGARAPSARAGLLHVRTYISARLHLRLRTYVRLSQLVLANMKARTGRPARPPVGPRRACLGSRRWCVVSGGPASQLRLVWWSSGARRTCPTNGATRARMRQHGELATTTQAASLALRRRCAVRTCPGPPSMHGRICQYWGGVRGAWSAAITREMFLTKPPPPIHT
jgi:hypothetical protein